MLGQVSMSSNPGPVFMVEVIVGKGEKPSLSSLVYLKSSSLSGSA
jgi:hypothetical protein